MWTQFQFNFTGTHSHFYGTHSHLATDTEHALTLSDMSKQ